MIKGIIFDFDGTLFDSMRIWVEAGELYLNSVGMTAEKDLWKKLKTMSLLQSAEYLKDAYSLPLSVDNIMNGINKVVEDFYFYHAMPKECVMDVLENLKARGIKMCIATATDRYQVEAALKRCNKRDYYLSYHCSLKYHDKAHREIYYYGKNHGFKIPTKIIIKGYLKYLKQRFNKK